MPISPPDLKWYKSMTIADSGANGGRMSAVQSPSGVKNNVLPDVTLTERTAGVTRHRKLFIKVANADNIVLQNARVFVQQATPGQDSVCFFPGTQRDTQAVLTGSERLYGAGKLAAPAPAGSASIQVATEGAALNYLRAGDLVRVSDKTGAASPGNEEFRVVQAVTYAGDVATVSLAEGLAYGYPSDGTVVSSVYQAGDVGATSTSPAVVSAGGTVAADGVLGDSIGTVDQDWTLTFTSATAFTITGDTLGNVGSGNVTGGAAPANPSFPGRAYFSLPAGAFGGAFATGDTVTFTTRPAAIPVWYKQVVPAGAAAVSGNQVILAVDGESA